MIRIPTTIHEVPFFRLLIPLVAGILIQHYTNLFSPLQAIALSILLTIIVLTARLQFKLWHMRWVFGVVVNLLLLIFGCLLVSVGKPEAPFKPNSKHNMLVRLTEPPTLGSNTVKVKAKIIDAFQHASMSSSTPVLLYFSVSDSNSYQLKYGDIVAISAKLREFSPPANPHQFNMKQYMYLQGIRYSASVREGYWERIGSNPNKIFNLSYRAQDYVIETFKEYGISGQELAVVSALMLGYKSLLDDEIRKVYSSVGAMHILAVSGLHVGLVFEIVLIFISLFPKRRYWGVIRLTIALAALWGYAFITGLSPSVCRATIMFSLFTIGQTASLKTNSYNTLSGAAFILLVSNPFMLFNVGFQLSFVAVLSIVVFHPIIYNIINFKNRILDYTWSLMAVSAAAQILTLPISLFNFGQFPLVFLVTNLIAIPLSTIVLYLSIATVALSLINPIGLILAKLLGFTTWVLNSGLKLIDSFPYASINNIYFSGWQAGLLTLSVLFTVMFIVNRKSSFLRLSIITISGVFALGAIHSVKIKNHSELVVFTLPKGSVICLNHGGNPLIVSYDSLTNHSYATSGYIRNYSLQKPTEIILGKSRNHEIPSHTKIIRKSGLALLITGNTSIAIAYNDSVKNISNSKPIEVDLLLVNRNCSKMVLNMVNAKKAIIDQSVSFTHANRLISTLSKNQIAIHNMRSSGYFKHSLLESTPKTFASQ